MSADELSQFYEAHIGCIYRFFFYKTFRREIAEDLTSQCFLRFAKEIKEKTIEQPKAYLFGIARYIYIDFLRNKYQEKELPLDEENCSIEEIIAEEPCEKDVVAMLEHVLPALPDAQARILRLRFVDKLALSEIAHKLGKDVNYVSTTQKRGLKSLKHYIECTDTSTKISE